MIVLLLAVTVLANTVLWPINRWVVRGGGAPRLYGLVTTATCAVLSGAVALATGQSLASWPLWTLAAVVAVAYVTGYWVAAMRCLAIGPVGPTVALNNMGLLWPVVVGSFWPRPAPVNAWVVSGAVLVLAALALLGSGTAPPAGGSQVALSRRWLAWGLAAWLLAGVSMTAQAVAAALLPQTTWALVFALSLLSALLLAPAALRPLRAARPGACGADRARAAGREVRGGLVGGLISVVCLVTILQAIALIGPRLVFPVTIALPAMLVLLLGRLLYHEHLTWQGWVACAAGVLGIAALAVGRA